MYDRATRSLWPQALGQAVVGPLTGQRLEPVPTQIVSWAAVRTSFPGGLVLSRDTGFSRPDGHNPYVGYDAKGATPFLFDGKVDPRLGAVERVLGLTVGGRHLAVPYPRLAARAQGGVRVVDLDLAGAPLLVVWRAGTTSALDRESIAGQRDRLVLVRLGRLPPRHRRLDRLTCPSLEQRIRVGRRPGAAASRRPECGSSGRRPRAGLGLGSATLSGRGQCRRWLRSARGCWLQRARPSGGVGASPGRPRVMPAPRPGGGRGAGTHRAVLRTPRRRLIGRLTRRPGALPLVPRERWMPGRARRGGPPGRRTQTTAACRPARPCRWSEASARPGRTPCQTAPIGPCAPAALRPTASPARSSSLPQLSPLGSGAACVATPG